MTITAPTTIYYRAASATEIEQRDVRVNGIAFRGRRRAAAADHRAGARRVAAARDHADGRLSLRLAGRGADRRARRATSSRSSRSTGRARSFADARGLPPTASRWCKVSASQTGLRGADRRVGTDGRVPREPPGCGCSRGRTCARCMKGAAHRTPIHRVLAIERHEINPPDFDERAAAAYASRVVMLRDTPEGYRYLRRERSTDDDRATPPAQPVRLPARRTRVRTLAVGVIVDPNISPAAAVRRAELRRLQPVRHRHAVQRVLRRHVRAAGVLGAVARRHPLAARRARVRHRVVLQRSLVRRTAASSTSANIRQRPAQAAVWLLRPLSARVVAPRRLRPGLHALRRGGRDRAGVRRARSPDRARRSRRARRAARRLERVGLVEPGARRGGWRAWGDGAGEYDRRTRLSALRRGRSRSRSWRRRVWSAARRGRLDGRRRPRSLQPLFVRHLRQPAARLSVGADPIRSRRRAAHGGGLVGGPACCASTVSSIRPRCTIRVSAPGCDYTGVGAAVEAPAPFGTLVAVEWGYGFRGINTDGGRGTQVIRISGYKVF